MQKVLRDVLVIFDGINLSTTSTKFEFEPRVTVVFRKLYSLKLGHVVFKTDHACTFIEIDLA